MKNSPNFSASDLLEKIRSLNCSGQKRAAELIKRIRAQESKAECEASLHEFVRQAWHILEPSTPLIDNWHIATICGYMEAFFHKKITRLIINVPPGTMKSLIVSVFYPAWAWAKRPDYRFLGVANGEDLSTRDSQRHKWLVESDWYQARWPLDMKKDQQGKGLFGNCKGGFRQAVGITGKITGKRGDDMLIDDPHNAKGVLSDKIRLSELETYDQELSSRLNNQETGGIALIMQRLHTDDMTGHFLKKTAKKFIHLVIPMEYEGDPRFDAGKDIGRPELNDPRTQRGELLCPKLFSTESVASLKEDLGDYGTAGQLQQRPTPKGGGIIKKVWWRQWEKGKPLPFCKHIFASYDTAYSERDRKNAAYSARTTWGIFEDEETGRDALILLAAWHDRVGYPDLKKEAKRHHREFNLDTSVIERKASGKSILQDLKRIRVPCRGFMPDKFGDKEERASLASPFFESGLVFYPAERQWAKDLIDYVAAFPNGAPPSADYTDTVTQAVLYTKKRMWLKTPDEDQPDPDTAPANDDDDEDNKPRKRRAYG
jgi:predicted phage terminase large subunit-like protein